MRHNRFFRILIVFVVEFGAASRIHGTGPDVVLYPDALDFGTQAIGITSQTRHFPAPSNAVSVAVGDFNADGKLDAVAATPSGSPASSGVTLLLGDGNG